MSEREIVVRPVTRWIVTDYEPGKGSRVIEEYPNRDKAWTAADAVAKALGLGGASVKENSMVRLSEKAQGQIIEMGKLDLQPTPDVEADLGEGIVTVGDTDKVIPMADAIMSLPEALNWNPK